MSDYIMKGLAHSSIVDLGPLVGADTLDEDKTGKVIRVCDLNENTPIVIEAMKFFESTSNGV